MRHGWYSAVHMPVGLASDTITNGADVVAPIYWSIGIDTDSGLRMAAANTARHISIANRALAVACMGRDACVRLVMLVRAATNGRIPCITVK